LTDPRSNSEWLAALRSNGASQSAALADLREVLLAGLRRGLSKWLAPYSPKLEALAEDTVQDALVRILDRLDSFEGRSQFTTWAHKVAINLALSELRRKQWQDVSLDKMLEPESEDDRRRSIKDEVTGPEQSVEQRELLDRLAEILNDELTERQLSLMKVVVLRDVPMEAIAQKMEVNRNALYKMMHDARVRLKRRLAFEGIELDDLLDSFEDGNTSQGQVI
jgi:RNA polymerase sigma-70 factor (ECF subfamily)